MKIVIYLYNVPNSLIVYYLCQFIQINYPNSETWASLCFWDIRRTKARSILFFLDRSGITYTFKIHFSMLVETKLQSFIYLPKWNQKEYLQLEKIFFPTIFHHVLHQDQYMSVEPFHCHLLVPMIRWKFVYNHISPSVISPSRVIG